MSSKHGRTRTVLKKDTMLDVTLTAIESFPAAPVAPVAPCVPMITGVVFVVVFICIRDQLVNTRYTYLLWS